VPRRVRYPGERHGAQHTHPGGRPGVQGAVSGATPELAARDEFKALAKEIAMQIAAASPTYVSRDAVPADLLEKERTIYRAQMENSGKPANVVDKIVEGKLGSFYEQAVLGDQPFVIRPEAKQTVNQVIAATNRALGAGIAVTRFARLKVGEVATA
jgi:elongation factor Ts